ncbi:hypothetical protein G7066_06185 [Leucobacter coleopterorum]|uniref:DUF6993 domain-containing protein n=1 Tax=Leucobacter coleopterorum TaxID=2714933 RepID=A0ABX6JZD9_9MICO|nr:hypothetical protein [Leucobacter coleopterorum]QIM18337.1 hypothetical protein G7066_06185 [Leucobacter coleopterorum]
MTESTTVKRLGRAALALGIALPLLAGCSVVESVVAGPTPQTPKREETTKKPTVAPVFVPDGTAEQNLPYFTEVIRKYTAGKEPIVGKPVAQAVIDAGFDPTMMQFSFDQTKTNLEADNIFVSVRIGTDCLIGQLVTADRTFVAKNEPAVGPNTDICLIGNTRSVDW